jgi:hypothetical protein
VFVQLNTTSRCHIGLVDRRLGMPYDGIKRPERSGRPCSLELSFVRNHSIIRIVRVIKCQARFLREFWGGGIPPDPPGFIHNLNEGEGYSNEASLVSGTYEDPSEARPEGSGGSPPGKNERGRRKFEPSEPGIYRYNC